MPTDESRDQRSVTPVRAGALLKKVYQAEKNSLGVFRKTIAAELKVTPKTIEDWARGVRNVPPDRQDYLKDALRSYRWRVEPEWRLATAVSELLKVNSKDFSEIDRYIKNDSGTEYKLLRFDGDGCDRIGSVTFLPMADQPRRWTYSFENDDRGTGQRVTRTYTGPLWKSGRSIVVLSVGDKESKSESYIRMDTFIPVSFPEEDETFGISLSTFSRTGVPLASPFVIVSKSRWNAKFNSDEKKRSLVEKLREQAFEGIIKIFSATDGKNTTA